VFRRALTPKRPRRCPLFAPFNPSTAAAAHNWPDKKKETTT